jgi:hypothetical protein
MAGPNEGGAESNALSPSAKARGCLSEVEGSERNESKGHRSIESKDIHDFHE